MNFFLKKRQTTQGFLLAEVLISASIIAISVLAATSVAQKSISMAIRTVHTAQSAFLLEEGAELTRVIRDNNWSNLPLPGATEYHPVDQGAGNWQFVAGAESINRFTRKVVFSEACRDVSSGDLVDCASGNPDSQTLLVTVTVSWGEGGENVDRTISFYLSNIFSS